MDFRSLHQTMFSLTLLPLQILLLVKPRRCLNIGRNVRNWKIVVIDLFECIPSKIFNNTQDSKQFLLSLSLFSPLVNSEKRREVQPSTVLHQPVLIAGSNSRRNEHVKYWNYCIIVNVKFVFYEWHRCCSKTRFSTPFAQILEPVRVC